MKNNNYLFILMSALCIFNYQTYAQSDSSKSIITLDGIEKKITEDADSNKFDIDYDALLSKEFTRIASGQSTNVGSFLSLDTKDNLVNFAANILTGNYSTINVNIIGGVTEGIVPLLNGEEVSPNISAKVQFNLGVYKDDRNILIDRDATKARNIFYSIDSLRQVFKKDTLELKLLMEKNLLLRKQNQDQIDTLNSRIDTLKSKIIKLDKGKIGRNYIKLDSLILLKKVKTNELEALNTIIEKLYQEEEFDRLLNNLQNRKVIAYKKIIDGVRIPKFTLSWFSFYGKINNRNFNGYIDSLDLQNQIVKNTFNSLDFGISYNIYRYENRPLKTYYISFGLSYLVDDNFTDLSNNTIIDKYDFSSPPLVRTIAKTTSVYVGEYNKDLQKIRAFIDLYYFFTKDNSFALHLNPILDASKGAAPKYDLMTGLLFGLRDKKDLKNIINFELFYLLKNLSEVGLVNGDTLSKRSSLGLRLTFPITFK